MPVPQHDNRRLLQHFNSSVIEISLRLSSHGRVTRLTQITWPQTKRYHTLELELENNKFSTGTPVNYLDRNQFFLLYPHFFSVPHNKIHHQGDMDIMTM